MYCKIEAAKYRRAVDNMVESTFSGKGFKGKNIRLREYAEYFYMAMGCKPLEKLTLERMTSTLARAQRLAVPVEYQIMRLVFDALVGHLHGGSKIKFTGCDIECTCGGSYRLNRPLWRYSCETCGLEGRADSVGLPCSLPAVASIRHKRNLIHRRIDTLLVREDYQVSFDDLYKLLAFKAHIPLPYMHLGWMTTDDEIDKVSLALSEVESELEVMA